MSVLEEEASELRGLGSVVAESLSWAAEEERRDDPGEIGS